MSHEATTLVKSRAFGSVSTKAVALVLADYCDAEWSCFVGQERLAWEAEVGQRTARRILQQLERGEIIARTARYRDGHRTSDLITMRPEAIESLPARMATMEDSYRPNDEFIAANGDIHTGHSLAGESLVIEPLGKNRGRCTECDGDKYTFDLVGNATPCSICLKRRHQQVTA